jgi:predicted amidohydrolase
MERSSKRFPQQAGHQTERRSNPGDEVADVKIGLCQTETVEWDVEGNFRRVTLDIKEAARQGAELIITPECVLNGYAGPGLPDWKTRFPATTEPMEGLYLTRVREQAKSLGVEIVFGFAERAEAGAFHNTAVLIDGNGGIVWAYRKMHCRPFESVEHDGLFTPGERFYVSEQTYAGGTLRVGAMICFDREIVESVRCLRGLKAEFIACPLATNTYSLTEASAPGRKADNEMITRARAAENEVFIAVVNHAGRFNGGSYLVGPLGETICQLGEAPEVRTVSIPLGVTTGLHSDPLGWMAWDHRRPAAYTPYLGGSDAGT